MRYITETRNLFDINSYSNLNNNSNITINGNSILCVALAANAHVLYRVPTVIGEKYTVSNKSVVRGGFVNTGNFCLFLSDNPNIDDSNYLAYGLQSGQSFTLTATSEFLYIHWYVCYNFDSNNPSTIEINELQVNLGDTATPYVPYGYLPMRRMKYKVSNVCQVLDKRTYPASGTNNGITFTHNGDGSYTANGTFASSDGSYFYFCSNEHKNLVKLFANHKYLVLNGAYYEAGTYSVWMVVNNRLVAESNGTVLGNGFNAKTYTPKKNEKADLSMRIVHKPNVDTVNFVFKPQLFDLTEMYGAGHEPTTIEDFRADFPDDLYEYTPYCWASMKNIRYLEKTKNLFDINKVTETDTLKVKGNSIYSYNYPVNTNAASTLSIFKSLKPNTNYTMSAITNYLGDSSTHITLVFNNGSIGLLTNYTSGFIHTTFSLTQEQIDSINAVYFYGKSESQGGPVIWSNIQIEEGNTATDYVPYGYLPLK